MNKIMNELVNEGYNLVYKKNDNVWYNIFELPGKWYSRILWYCRGSNYHREIENSQ